MKVDLLIIGGGPAGLSAALFFSRLKRPTLVYDSGVYRNAGVQVAHTILGHEGVNPAEYRSKARQEIQDGYPWTTFRDTRVTSLTRVCDAETKKDVFKAVDALGQEVWARKVVLATGIQDHLLPIPGVFRLFNQVQSHLIILYRPFHMADTPIQYIG
jgi:thioredoxin reductase